MGELIDPHDASIDELIDWLGARRRRDPSSPLSKLLADQQIEPQRLVDIACIDLMQRRRMNHAVKVETYVEEFPCLSSASRMLDLIDAELCIASELGEPIDVGQYTQRFPDLADQVQQLFRLDMDEEDSVAPALVQVSSLQSDSDPGGATMVGDLTDSSAPCDMSIEVASDPSEEPNREISALADHPLDMPDWFVAEQCIASSPGRWLIRGRDSARGGALALKVTELPSLITAEQSKLILDACEVAARVRNPSWVSPMVAAVQQRHLGVIRPWLFARPWQSQASALDARVQLRNLASVAFAVESAHSRGATHGGIHLENLLIDHDGKVQVLDGASSRLGLDRWLNPANRTNSPQQQDGPFASLSERKNIDSQDLIKLTAAASVDWPPELSRDLIADLRRTVDRQTDQVCGAIGDKLMEYADATTTGGTGHAPHLGPSAPWRRRLAHWLTRER